jgi:hypothetical protein
MTSGTHCTGGWVGPRAGLDTEDRRKILCPRRGSNPDHPVVQPVVRHYTAWANPAPTPWYLRNDNCLKGWTPLDPTYKEERCQSRRFCALEREVESVSDLKLKQSHCYKNEAQEKSTENKKTRFVTNQMLSRDMWSGKLTRRLDRHVNCTSNTWDFKFSQRRVWISDLSSGMYCRVK